jgi:hypothetical protein
MPSVRLPNGQVVQMTDAEYRAYQQRQQQQSGGGGRSTGQTMGGAVATGAIGAGIRHGVRGGLQGISGLGHSATGQTIGSYGNAVAGPVGSSGYNAAVSGSSNIASSGAGGASGAAPIASSGSLGSTGGGAVASPGGDVAGAAGTSALGNAANWAGVAGQAYQYGTNIYDSYNKLTNDTARDDGAGATKAALLSTGPFLGWASPLVDFAGIKTGKHRNQLRRETAKKNAQEIGLVDENFRYQLPDGSYFNLGSENMRGFSADPNERGEKIDGRTPSNKNYNIDWENADHELIGALNPIGYLLAAGNAQDYGYMTSQLYNMVQMSDDPRATIQKLYDDMARLGYDRDTMAQLVNVFADQNEDDAITRAEADAFISGIDVNTRHQLTPEFQASLPPKEPSPEPMPEPGQIQEPPTEELGVYNPSNYQGRPPAVGQQQDPIAAALGGGAVQGMAHIEGRDGPMNFAPGTQPSFAGIGSGSPQVMAALQQHMQQQQPRSHSFTGGDKPRVDPRIDPASAQAAMGGSSLDQLGAAASAGMSAGSMGASPRPRQGQPINASAAHSAAFDAALTAGLPGAQGSPRNQGRPAVPAQPVTKEAISEALRQIRQR